MLYEVITKKISENQYVRLLQKGSTVNLKGFKTENDAEEGLIRFDEHFRLILEPKKKFKKGIPDVIKCPKCKSGTVVKGKTAYGCSKYKSGCDFVITSYSIHYTKLYDETDHWQWLKNQQ